MPFAAALSTLPESERAAEEVCGHAGALGAAPDLAVVFFSPHHRGPARQLARSLHQRLGPRCLLGCVAESVIGNDREVEGGPALSLWLARWAGPVTMTPFHLVLERTADGPSLLGWPDALLEAGADP